MNRQRLVLSGLVVVLALSLLYAFWAMPRQEKAPPRETAPKPTASQSKTGKPVQSNKAVKQLKPVSDRLLLELLSREAQEFPGAGRDIFRFGGMGQAVVVEAEPVEPVEVEPLPEPPKPPPTPEEILQGSLKDIVFLGFLDKGGKRTVFLTSGEDLYLVKAGERFGKNKELIAKEITAKQLVVGWVDGPETVKVQLLENEKLQPTTISSPSSGTSRGGVGFAGARPGAAKVAPRRLLMPQRTPSVPPPAVKPPSEEPVDEDEGEDEGQPTENISQEELLEQGLPSGE